MIAHIVLFTPKAGLADPERRSFAQSVADTCTRIRQVKRLMLGRRLTVDAGYQRSFGDATYEYAAVLEFETQQDLKEYLQDPRHAALGRLFWQYCERSVVAEMEWLDPADSDVVNKLVE
jgi:Stress responsive A/B Barrel Domain